MKIIKATFDGPKPEQIQIKLSDGTNPVLSGNFEISVSDQVVLTYAELVDGYNIVISEDLAKYTLKPEAQVIAEKVKKLKEQLASQDSPYGDWKNSKQLDTGEYTPEQMAEYRAVRQSIREQIRALENK